MRKKGAMAVETVVQLVLGIVVLGALTYFLYTNGPQLLEQFRNFIENLGFGLGGERGPIQKAIECAYYRCKDGCYYSKVAEISWVEGGNLVKCSDFCKAEWTDTGLISGKICGFRSRQYPVEVKNVLKDQERKISKESLKDVAQCVLKRDEMIVGRWDTDKTDYPKYVAVDSSIIEDEGTILEDCWVSLTKFSDSLKNFRIKEDPGTFYVSTDLRDFAHLGGSYITYLWGSPSYYLLKPGVSRDIEIPEDDNTYRIVVKNDDGDIVNDASIKVISIDSDYVSFKFNCNGMEQDLGINEGQTRTACSTIYEITLDRIDGSTAIFRIKYNELDCHEGYSLGTCPSPCIFCKKLTASWDEGECCYPYEVCDEERGKCVENVGCCIDCSCEDESSCNACLQKEGCYGMNHEYCCWWEGGQCVDLDACCEDCSCPSKYSCGLCRDLLGKKSCYWETFHGAHHCASFEAELECNHAAVCGDFCLAKCGSLDNCRCEPPGPGGHCECE